MAHRRSRALGAMGLTVLASSLLSTSALAQAGAESNITGDFNPIDTYSFQLSVLFIAFGLIVIALQLLAVRHVRRITADDIARNCAITLIVVSSVALLVSGYSSAQVAPAFGLFGTIVGYLLGRANSPRRDQDSPQPPTPDPDAKGGDPDAQ